MTTRPVCLLGVLVLACFASAGCSLSGDDDERVQPEVPMPPVEASEVTDAYLHVTPADVGVTVGAGVVAPEPTLEFEDDVDIDRGGLIENRIINGCVNIRADNVVLRNVVIRCIGWHGVANLNRAFTEPVPIDGLVIEHSRIECAAGETLGKLFRLSDARNVVIRNNELIGCDQTFFLNGDLDGFVIERNLQRDPIIGPASHWEAISIGEEEGLALNGTVSVTGNSFSTGDNGGGVGITDVVFVPFDGGGALSLVLESNYFPAANVFTVRCNGEEPGLDCALRYNVFDDDIRLFGSIGFGLEPAVVRCNRFADGEIIANETTDTAGFAAGVVVDNEDCPDLAPVTGG